MTTRYAQTTTTISIHLVGDSPVFGESVTTVSLDDEGGGPFIVLHRPDGAQQIRLDLKELELIMDAARMLMEGVENEGNAAPINRVEHEA